MIAREQLKSKPSRRDGMPPPASCFDAFSLREPVSTSLENALINKHLPDGA